VKVLAVTGAKALAAQLLLREAVTAVTATVEGPMTATWAKHKHKHKLIRLQETLRPLMPQDNLYQKRLPA
jgi:hypothetical protein